MLQDGSKQEESKQDSSRITPRKSPAWVSTDLIEGAGSSTKTGGSSRGKPSRNTKVSLNNNTVKGSPIPEVSMLQEQLAQSTMDVKRLQRSLEERNTEVRRYQRELADVRAELSQEKASVKEIQRAANDLQARLREKESQVHALEAKHADTVAIMSQQISAVRESRDEEIQCLAVETKESIVALNKEHEAELNKARAIEAELRQGTQRLREENQHLRSVAQKAEGRMAEAELSSARATSKFESAVITIRQLEEQYENLSRDASAAEKLRNDRIHQLEEELEGIQLTHAAAIAEKEASLKQALESLRNAEATARQNEINHQDAEIVAAQHATTATKLRQELASVTEKCQALETELESWREQALIAQADVQRHRGAYEGAQSLLEATKLALESAHIETDRVQTKLEKMEDQRKEEVGNIMKLLEDVKQSKCEEINALREQMLKDEKIKEQAWEEERQVLTGRIRELEEVRDAHQGNAASDNAAAVAAENEELRSQLAQLKLSLIKSPMHVTDGIVAIDVPTEPLPEKEDALTKARRQVLLAKEYLRTLSQESEEIEG